MQVSVMFARFPHKGTEHPDSVNWIVETYGKIKRDHRIGDVFHVEIDDTPITMSRNLAVLAAREKKADYILMIDNDMAPDLPGAGQKPFWDTSFDFALSHRDDPCLIGAPYCGPPPHNNVYIFQWANWMNEDTPDQAFRLAQFGREEAARLGGIQDVAALPTGLILIDMRVFDHMEPPWFYYEWKDKYHSEKSGTEDVTFTRDCSLRGFTCYCNWDAWAGHHKPYRVDKPRPITVEQINDNYVKAMRQNIQANERIFLVGEGSNGATRKPVRVK